MTSTYFSKVSLSYIENWASELYELSIPHIPIRLSLEEASVLELKNRQRCYLNKTNKHTISQLSDRLSEAIAFFYDSAFVRLGSRSAKDSVYAQLYGQKATDGKTAIQLLTDFSQRIAFDLKLALNACYAPYIFVRKWVNIEPWSELRCFMKKRQLIGISQYDCKNLKCCHEIVNHAEMVESSIRGFFDNFKQVCHIEDVVFDVFVKWNDAKTAFNVTLLELNPFFPKTDACLFSWKNGGDFDGSFKLIKE